MKILFVTLAPPCPPVDGGRMRRWALLRAVAAEGHRITLASFDADDSADGLAEVERMCERVRYLPLPRRAGPGRSPLERVASLAGRLPHGTWKFRCPRMAEHLAGLLRRERFDFAVCNDIYAYVNLPRPCPVPLVLDKPDVTHLILDRYLRYEPNPAVRAYGRLDLWKLRRWERDACAAAAHVVACSETDACALRALCPGIEVSVIPNVVDIPTAPADGTEEEKSLLYCGSVDWHPNRDAVQFFVSRILPLLDRLVEGVRLTVSGNKPAPAFVEKYGMGGRVHFTGRVPDIAPLIARHAISIVPLRIGSGTRLKILEAAALGKAVVSTRLGAEGLDFKDGAEIRLADTPSEFAQAIAELLADPARRKSMGLAARRRAIEQYSFSAVETGVAQMLSRVGMGARAATP